MHTFPVPRALLALAVLLLALEVVHAGDPPKFESDAAADQWLRQASPYYRMMAEQIETRAAPYSFRGSDEISGGMVGWESGKLIIEMSNTLSGPKRLSILIFEITNAFQDAQHREVDAGANTGRITSPREFGILHELVELDGLRHHRFVLQDLDRKLQGIPAAMLEWINPELKKLSDYELPYAFEYIKAQESGGHTKHYHEWFYRQAPPAAKPAAP